MNNTAGTTGAESDPSRPPTRGGVLQAALDVLVFAPIGFVLSAGTLVPELARKGRARAEEQVRLARTIGQLAVPVVRRKGEKVVRDQVARARSGAPRSGATATVPDTTPVAPSAPIPARRGPKPTQRTRTAAPPTALPIDGYDGLPASSIVTLLDGLRPSQLRAIDAHERANRGRRTILTRVAQLLA